MNKDINLERLATAAERISDALEAQLELAKARADPMPISREDIAIAGRDQLLIYAKELGVTAWCGHMGFAMHSISDEWLRKRCLEGRRSLKFPDEFDVGWSDDGPPELAKPPPHKASDTP